MNINNWEGLNFKRKCEYMEAKIKKTLFYKKERLNNITYWYYWDFKNNNNQYKKRRILNPENKGFYILFQ